MIYICVYVLYIVAGSVVFAVLETSGAEDDSNVTEAEVSIRRAILSKCPDVGEGLSIDDVIFWGREEVQQKLTQQK